MLTAYIRGTAAEAVERSKVIKYEKFLLPEYFRFYVYIADTDGKVIPKTKQGKQVLTEAKAWSIEQLIRVRSGNSLQIISTTIKGVNKKLKGHPTVIMAKSEDDSPLHPKNYLPVKPIYYRVFVEQRAVLMGFAITTAVQHLVAVKQKDGSYSFNPFSINRDLTEVELQKIAKATINTSYKKKDQTFYEDIATEYEQAVMDGDRPNNRLQQKTGKNLKTVQGYVTEARKRGLLAPTTPGKVSPVRKAKKAGKK